MDRTTELQKDIDAIDKRYEQWLQRTKDAFDRVDAIVEELEEPYKTESMYKHIREVQECILDCAKIMVLDKKHFLYQTTIRDYAIKALIHKSDQEYAKLLRCSIKMEELNKEYEEFLLKEGLQ